MAKPTKRDNQKTLLVKKLAEKHGVTPEYIWMVVDGSRTNESILADYLELESALENLFDEFCQPCKPQILSFKNTYPAHYEKN